MECAAVLFVMIDFYNMSPEEEIRDIPPFGYKKMTVPFSARST